MPLKLNVGLSRKVGLPDYGSLGATCHIELELAHSLIHEDLDGFHRQVRQAFTACSQAVQEELAKQRGHEAEQVEPVSVPAQAETKQSSNGNGAQASTKQISYIHSLAGQIKQLGSNGLDRLSQRMFGKATPQLNGLEASNLIETLQAIKAGRLPVSEATAS